MALQETVYPDDVVVHYTTKLRDPNLKSRSHVEPHCACDPQLAIASGPMLSISSDRSEIFSDDCLQVIAASDLEPISACETVEAYDLSNFAV